MTIQRTLSTITFRDFIIDDYPRMVEIYNSNFPDYTVSVPEQRGLDDSIDQSKYLLKRIVAMDQTNNIVGIGQIRHGLDAYHPSKFIINVWVDPIQHKKGIGSAIYQKLDEELAHRHAILVSVFCNEQYQNLRDFYIHRGFKQIMRNWESRLDVDNTDTKKFQQYVQKASSGGITFTTLAKERALGYSLKGLFELVDQIVEDMPRADPYTSISYEQWEKLNFTNPRLLPEGYVIAKHGSEYVGVSIVFKNDTEPQVLSQDDTGVRRDYRGKGIAVAMKIKVIEYAKKHNYKMIKTWNDSTNAAMLGINTKLGFKRQTGWVLMQKALSY